MGLEQQRRGRMLQRCALRHWVVACLGGVNAGGEAEAPGEARVHQRDGLCQHLPTGAAGELLCIVLNYVSCVVPCARVFELTCTPSRPPYAVIDSS